MTAYRSPGKIIVYTGQSLFLAPPGGNTAPVNIKAAIPRRVQTVTNISGTIYNSRLFQLPMIDNMVHQVTGQRVLIECGGSSDLQSGFSSSTVLASCESWLSGRKTAGYDLVIACTVPVASILAGASETQRQAFNTALKASSVPDAVADIAALPELADYHNTTYFSDTIHPTTAGALAISNCILAVLAAHGITS